MAGSRCPVLSDRTDVRGREDPMEIEMTRRETTSPEADKASPSTGDRVVSDRQQPPNFSSLVLHTYTYTVL